MSLLNMSFSASALILVIVILRALLLYKFPPKIFIVLWGVVLCRLLIPFEVSSRFSIYSVINMLKDRFYKPDLSLAEISAMLSNTAVTETIATLPETANVNVSPFVVIWIIGLVACALFFLITHMRCRREYKTSLPVNNEFAHIRRFDTMIKLVMVTALCVHWFNPFVWLMYVIANRDIELSCDEAVVRIFGENVRLAYALTLIELEERRNRFAPLVNNFSKNAIEERIQAIMPYKKASILTSCIAFILIISSVTVFATSAQASELRPFNQEKSKVTLSNNNQSFIFENVELSYYDNGHPYLHDVKTNNTDKIITGIQYGMLSYDESGGPLKLQWNFLDSSSESTYEYLVKEELDILPQQTYNVKGGWSLYDSEKMDWPEIENAHPNKVAYALYQIKGITFEDGSVWNNSEYSNWLETYKGKTVEVPVLESFYPSEYKIMQ